MYKTLVAGLASLVIAASPSVKPADAETKGGLDLLPSISKVQHIDKSFTTDFYIKDGKSNDVIVHLYYNEGNGTSYIWRCKDCEENKGQIKGAIDSSIMEINSSDLEKRTAYSGLRKYLRYVSRSLSEGKGVRESVKYANDNANFGEDAELDFEKTAGGYLQGFEKKAISFEPTRKPLEKTETKRIASPDSFRIKLDEELSKIRDDIHKRSEQKYAKTGTSDAAEKSDSAKPQSSMVYNEFYAKKRDAAAKSDSMKTPAASSVSLLSKLGGSPEKKESPKEEAPKYEKPKAASSVSLLNRLGGSPEVKYEKAEEQKKDSVSSKLPEKEKKKTGSLLDRL